MAKRRTAFAHSSTGAIGARAADPVFSELLDLVARQLAEEYIRLMRHAADEDIRLRLTDKKETQ